MHLPLVPSSRERSDRFREQNTRDIVSYIFHGNKREIHHGILPGKYVHGYRRLFKRIRLNGSAVKRLISVILYSVMCRSREHRIARMYFKNMIHNMYRLFYRMIKYYEQIATVIISLF